MHKTVLSNLEKSFRFTLHHQLISFGQQYFEGSQREREEWRSGDGLVKETSIYQLSCIKSS